MKVTQAQDWRYRKAGTDLMDGLMAFDVWGLLGWHDVRQRYRRSIIGPFWLTINSAVFVGALAIIYSQIMQHGFKEYICYLAAGYIVWTYIATTLNESCTVFIANDYIIKQIKIPLTIHASRMVFRNIITLLHSLPVAILVFLFMGKLHYLGLIAIPFALILLWLNGIWISVVFGIIAARFRDFPLIITNIVQTAFFVTPVMWMPSAVKQYGWIITVNPFAYFVEIVRNPLVYGDPCWTAWGIVVIVTILGLLLAQFMLMKFRKKLSYWI
jgi:ABC-2 type transport system permease protein